MKENPEAGELTIPQTSGEAANWLRMLAREINTFVLFLQTWGAMGFMIDPGVVSSLLELQSKILEVRSRLGMIDQGKTLEKLRDSLTDIASHEETVYRQLTDEIKRFKEESEDIFPSSKLNFDPCF
ncbi:MAG: hypothetical protein LN412_05155 [Candidatus Thermoplasmatota archaeon]|nr:hypothetical protein [Candidatus Thermoplasmatota archaeon]